uniref:Uncharacterized protein n=1 Tax=Tetranychus urticae TaxID=32264 RepID=T1KIY3_TETUR
MEKEWPVVLPVVGRLSDNLPTDAMFRSDLAECFTPDLMPWNYAIPEGQDYRRVTWTGLAKYLEMEAPDRRELGCCNPGGSRPVGAETIYPKKCSSSLKDTPLSDL